MKKLLKILFEPHILSVLFIVALVMFIVTEIELKIFDIPKKYDDGLWLSNIVLTFLIYYISVWLNKTD